MADKSCQKCAALPITNGSPQTKAYQLFITTELAEIIHLAPGS